MIFRYKVITQDGQTKEGTIDAISPDLAVSALQKRGFIVVSVQEGEASGILKKSIPFFDKVKQKDVVIMSRQVAALFEAQVPAVRTFSLLADSMKSPVLRRVLSSVAQDIQGGITISEAMQKNPEVFTDFYVNMVRAAEESGRLTETFNYLADYLERQYELASKTRNALVYPAFVVLTFFIVIILMLTMVIPRLSVIILESGGDVPFYTQIVIGLSNFTVKYGFIILIFVVILGLFLWRQGLTKNGKLRIDRAKIRAPYFGDLFKKLYLSRIADNMDTMLTAGIPVVRALEITAAVVGNTVFEQIVKQAVEDVKAGDTISTSFQKHEDIPNILVAMIRVGEETGSLGSILQTLARFYKREVSGAVDTLIGLIEPALIVFLGVAVGFLLTSVLIPIYNIAGSI
jgi:type IV pilus assembly protein PilC